MPRLQARRLREACLASGRQLSIDQVYALVLAETGSEDEAAAAASAHAAAALKAGQTPE